MMEAVRQRSKTYDLVYVSIFVVLIAVCSWISIPLTVPVTLQTFGVFIAVGLLGGKRGTLAVLVYILMGAIGIPVFSGFTGFFQRSLCGEWKNFLEKIRRCWQVP